MIANALSLIASSEKFNALTKKDTQKNNNIYAHID